MLYIYVYMYTTWGCRPAVIHCGCSDGLKEESPVGKFNLYNYMEL